MIYRPVVAPGLGEQFEDEAEEEGEDTEEDADARHGGGVQQGGAGRRGL